MKYLINIGCAITATCLMAGSAFSQDVPEYVNIKGITAAGSGCPVGTIARNVSTDRKAFTMTFSDYFAEVAPGSDLSDARRNCTLTVDLDFPAGWSYTLVDFDYRGYVYADDDVSAEVSAAYYFQSEQDSKKFSAGLTGYLDEDYQFRDNLALDAVVWSPDCESSNRPLNIQTEIKVNNRDNPDGEGLITVDSADGEFKQKYGIVWRKCGGQDPDPQPDVIRPDYDDQFPLVPANLTISDLVYNGSGCPLGTIAQTISTDKKAFTLAFDSFIAEAGPGVSRREARKNCQLTMSLDYPSDWTFALATFDYRGYMYLDDAVTATQSANYYFQGQANSINQQAARTGYEDDDYHFRHVVPLDALVWAPCGIKRALNINSSIRINNRKARDNSGLITVDSQDGEFRAYHALVWRKC